MQSWKLVAAVSALWLFIWFCSGALHGPRQQAKPVESRAPVQFVARNRMTQHATSRIPPSDTASECSVDQYTYPTWPDGFNITVNALFVVGANLRALIALAPTKVAQEGTGFYGC